MHRYHPLLVSISLALLLVGVVAAEDTRAVRLRYNDQNQVTEILGPGQRKIAVTYDPRGRIQTLDNGEKRQRFEYDALGQLRGTTDLTGTTALRYDANGRLQELSYPQGDTIGYRYHDNGTVASVAWGNQHFLRYERDLLGNPVKIVTPVGDFQFRYDYDKGIMQRSYPNGASSEFHYNRDGRPLLIQHATPDHRPFLRLSYTYDDAGLLKTATEKTPRREFTISYSYDAYGQLQRADYSDGRRYEYDYDPFGNRIRAAEPSGQTQATYDDLDRLTSLDGQPVAHDDAGNVTAIGRSRFTYNASDALTDDGTSRYTYNALGLRVAVSDKTGESRFLHVITDLPYVLAETGVRTTRYLWADRQVLGQIGNDDQPLFFFEDQLGSIRAAMDAAGTLVGYAEYAPFGEPVKRMAGVRFGFAGEEQNETGAVFLRRRYYYPVIGRFSTREPMLPDIADTMKQSAYAYVNNSPVNYTDRSALKRDDWDTWAGNAQSFVSALVLSTLPAYHPPTGSSVGSAAGPSLRSQNPEPSHVPVTPSPPPMSWNNPHGPTYQYLSPTGDALYRLGTAAVPVVGSLSRWKVSIPLFLASHPDVRQSVGTFSKTITLVNSSLGIAGFGNPATSVVSVLGFFAGTDSNAAGVITGDITPQAFAQRTATGVIATGVGVAASVNSAITPINNAIRVYRIADTLLGGVSPAYQSPTLSVGVAAIEHLSVAAKEYLSTVLGRVHSPTPNVGGVYLNKAAELMGDLGDIEGVTFDPVSNRLLLVGNNTDKAALPPMRLDDLAAAFRSVFGNYETEPGVTIDPDPRNPKADQMPVRFFGGMENTHFGMILFEADRQMKSLSLGRDNLTRKKVTAKIKDYYNLLDLSLANFGGQSDDGLWSRFWLVPERVPVKVSDDKRSISFPDTRIRVNTETMRWGQGKLDSAEGQRDEKAEYFAAHLTKYYDDYAREFPVYEELRQLTNMVGLAKWIKDTGIPIDLAWLRRYEGRVRTPSTTPALTVRDTRRLKQGNGIVTRQAAIFGGVELKVVNAYSNNAGAVSRSAQKALQAVAAQPGVASATFLDDHQETRRVVALPTSQTRAAGAKMLAADELVLAERLYCSFHNETGPFGHSWSLDLPVLQISQPDRGKQEVLTLGESKVLVQQFHLSRPFGMGDVRFADHTVDQQYGRIAFLPDRRAGLRAIYPDNETMEYRLEHDDGSADIFDAQGTILRRESSPTEFTQYAYDGPGRLASIELHRHSAIITRVALRYNDQGFVAAATMPGGTVLYTYDNNDDLVRVSGPDRTLGYTYDARHLITGIQVDGGSPTRLAYDALGRVMTEEEPTGRTTKTAITARDDLTEITEGTAGARVTRRYDGGGRLVETVDASGNRVTLAYHDSDSPQRMQYTSAYGDTTTLDYSADGRQLVATDPARNTYSLALDAFGRVLELSQNGASVLHKEYGMTDQGWLESTETPEDRLQVIANADRTPSRWLLTAKTAQGGQLAVTHAYDPDGKLARQDIQGLIQGELVYHDGRLVKQTAGDATTTFSYNDAGQVQEVASDGARGQFSYDAGGVLQSLRWQHGGMDAVSRFDNGQLVQRQNNRGLNDAFRYDSQGVLQGVRRAGDALHGDEEWEIRRDPRSLRILRNGVLQVQLLWDGNDRLVEMIH